MMFKKPLKVSTHNLLGGKDKKTLKKDLCKLFHQKSIEHFFENNEKVYCDKMQGSKIVVYSTDNFPAFVDSTGKGAFFPTLYFVQAYPKALEPVFINPGVSNFIFNGANLMWPGVKLPEKMSEFKADDVRVIISDSNKAIAIGAMGCDYSDLKTNNLQGVAVYVLHMLDDKLWETGPKTPIEVVFSGEEKIIEQPPSEDKKKGEVNKEEVKREENDDEEENDDDEDDLAKFAEMVKKGKKNDVDEPVKPPKKEVIKSDPIPPPKKDKKDDSEDEDDKKKKGGKKKGGKGKKEEEKTNEKEKEKEKDKGKDKKNKEKEKDTKKKDNKKQEKGKKEKKNEEEDEEDNDEKNESEDEKNEEENENQEKKQAEPAIPLKIMDEYIYEAFMNAIRMAVTEKDLPIDSSAFYSNHMLMCKRENIIIDLKNSTYKKIGKFFQEMAKLKLIEYKEAKKGTSPQITKINRSHEKYEKWEPTISKIGSKKFEEEKKTSDEKWPKVIIEDLYKPKDNLKQLFPIEEKKPDSLYTHEEARNILQEYIKKNCKLEKKFIVMDPYLLSLFPPLKEEFVPEKDVEKQEKEAVEGEEGDETGEIKKKPKRVVKYESPNHIVKEELFQRYEEYLLKWHRITNLETKKFELRAGQFKGISVIAEKAHNKNITKITGLEIFCIDLNDISSKFQLKFACSVSLHDLPGKNAGKEVIVHGNFLQDIIDYLSNECKVDRKYISSLNKLEKKKK